jgi:hypothetical protein
LQDILSPKPKGGDKYVELQAEKYAIAARDTYVLQQEMKQGEAALISDGKLERRLFGEVDARLGIRSLDIIDEFQQMAGVKKNPGGWGFKSRPTKFTRNARHRLLEAGAVVDAEVGKNVYVVTLTLPGGTDKALETLANYSGWICNRLLLEVRRNTKNLYWFYVWERQKRGALHMHFAIGSSNISDAKKVAETLEYQWFELLLELQDKTDVDLFKRRDGGSWRNRPEEWRSEVAPVRKSVAAYFSKYASKSTNESSDTNNKYYPARWWGSSRAIKQGIKQRREKWEFKASLSCSKEIKTVLEKFLVNQPRLKKYDYHFELGKTANGANLGWGDVCINYYGDAEFAQMQKLEEYYMFQVLDVLRRHGYADIDTQTWCSADVNCPTPYDADLACRHDFYAGINIKSRIPSPPPLSQPSPDSRKLRMSRGTQPQATLDIRARLIKFLAGGGGEVPTNILDNRPHQEANKPIVEYVQGELFSIELLRRY